MSNQINAFHLAEANFFDMICVDRLQTEHLLAFATGVQSSNLNHAVVYHLDGAFQESLLVCCDFYANKNDPWALVVSDKYHSKLEKLLHQHVFVEIDKGVAMALLLHDMKNFPINTALEVRIMRGSLDEWSAPVMLGFESTPERMRPYTLRHQLAAQAGKAMVHFSGFIDNQAVCSLTLTLCDENTRIDDVSTNPAFQRKGYASALMIAALRHAKERQATTCFLEASVDGFNVYKKIGFCEIFTNYYYEK